MGPTTEYYKLLRIPVLNRQSPSQTNAASAHLLFPDNNTVPNAWEAGHRRRGTKPALLILHRTRECRVWVVLTRTNVPRYCLRPAILIPLFRRFAMYALDSDV